jgi:hypothetical protein
LTRLIFERIDRYNPELNAFTYQLREEALSHSRNADETQSRGESPWDFARCSCSREGVLWCGGPSVHVGSLSLP